MKTSEAIDKVFEAFITAQSQIPELEKNKTVEVKNKSGQFLYNYNYTDLNEIIRVCRPILFKNGLGYTQYMTHHDQLGLCYATKFLHKSGQWLETGYTPVAIAEHAEMRDVGGVATYGQRISLKASLGLSAEDDNDGPNRKDEVTTPVTKEAPAGIAKPQSSEQQRGITMNNLLTSFKKLGVSEKQIKQYFSTKNVYTITDQQINELASIGRDIQARKKTVSAVFGGNNSGFIKF